MEWEETTQNRVDECDVCKNQVSIICTTCHVQLCRDCVPKHLSDNITHSVVPYNISNYDIDTYFCYSHPTKKCDLFCEDCQIPVCVRCMTSAHISHQFTDIMEKKPF